MFGNRDTGFYLRKFAWTPIVRHRMVAGTASPDDPALTDYWAERRRRSKPPLGTATLRLLRVAARPMPALPGAAAARRPRAAKPTRVGTVAHGHPQGDPQTRDHRLPGARHAGRTRRTPPHTRPLPPPDHRRRRWTSTSAPPASLQGLLEPVAWKAGTAGSEGAPAQQCAGATRRVRVRRVALLRPQRHRPPHP